MADRIITQLPAIPKPATFKEAAKATLRVAAYARVSTDNEDQETSLAAQTDYYQKKIIEHPGWEFVQIYVDDGISGLSTKHRDGFNKLIADCLSGHIDLVLTKSISRFARNTVDTVTTIRMLKEKGVGVYFEKENIFTTDSKGEFLLTIMSSLAQEESRSISENVTWGQRKRLSDGKVSLAYSRFLGYDKGPEKYTMVVNPEQAMTVRRIFFLFLQGYTSHTISNILTEEGVPAPGGGDVWNQQTIRRMLSNEKYKGDALLQKDFTIDYLRKKTKKNEGEVPQYYVEGDHEAIISPWLFDYVQEKLEERLAFPGRYSGLHLLTSKVICGGCGEMYHPRPWHSTSYNNLKWQCKNTCRKGEKCRTPKIYDKLLHYMIHDAARIEAYKRDVVQRVVNTVNSVTDKSKTESIRHWMSDLEKRDIWEMQSDENDIVIALNNITVMPDGTLRIKWLDDKVTEYRIPKYTPSEGIENEDKQKHCKRSRKCSITPRKSADEPPIPVIDKCKNCSADILQKPKTKKKKFCCAKCRNQWWNKHLDNVNRKTYYEVVCQNCGKKFIIYGDNRRKYCCHECYLEDRFG
ncbi:MAG: recombinase family protein [Ruminococcus sp.]|nr:recombinase family protein [Ruminococcus sp.]